MQYRIKLSDFQICLVIVLALITEALNAGSNFYRAAVFEHAMVRDMLLPKSEILQKNLMNYKVAANTAGLHGADIIVFPEWGLFPHDRKNRTWLFGLAEDIPDPKEIKSNPCEESNDYLDRPILKKLSCLAKDNSLFLVANVLDSKKCQTVEFCEADEISSCSTDDCPEDGTLFHNTNVVFNREGDLIARYYKRHLYFEHDINPIKFPEDIYFETDFGKFTTCICFDLSFGDIVGSVEKGKVHNVAYPTYWYDHMPMIYFATPLQQAWAMGNRVNLLAANTQLPGTGSLGSGIYSSDKGALIYSHIPDGKSKILISNVPKNPNEEADMLPNTQHFVIDNGAAVEVDIQDKVTTFDDQCQLDILGFGQNFTKDYRCHPTNLTNYSFIKLVKNKDFLSACSNNFCCTLKYDAQSMNENYYLLISGKAVYFKGYFFGIESCFLARCDDHDNAPCSNFILNSHTIFNEIEIKGNFSSKYIYPFAVNSGVQLTNRGDWSYDKSSIVYRNSDRSSLLFFGLNGRFYEQDILL